MPDPIELPPANAACCVPVHAGCDKTMIGQKLRAVLCNLAPRFPDKFAVVEIWRRVENPGGFGGSKPMIWVKIADNVTVAVSEHHDRWFQQSVGLLERTDTRVLLPDIYGVEASDEIIFPHAVSMLVIDKNTGGGIATLRCDKSKSVFIRPPRTAPVYRVVGAGARIQ